MQEVTTTKGDPSRLGHDIHVVHLRDTARICGPGKTILETVRNNADRDIRYSVAAFGPLAGNAFLQEASTLCETFRLPASRSLLPLAAVELALWIRRHGASIVHAHDFKSDAVAILAASLTHAIPITTVHGFIVLGPKSRAYATANMWMLRRMKRVLVVSEATGRYLVGQKVGERTIRVVRNCIVLGAYPFGYRSGVLRKDSGFSDGQVVIGCIGRLSEEKGQRLLIEAFPRVLEQVPTARLVFAGDGPDAGYLRARVTALGLEHLVRFLGHRSDIREVYGGLDLLALSSYTEGLPNVVLEAMALGIPVVATDVGGTAELLQDGVTGLLVPPGNADALTAAISDVLMRRGAAHDRATAARHHVEAEFDMSTLIRRTHTIYREMIASTEWRGAGADREPTPGQMEGPGA